MGTPRIECGLAFLFQDSKQEKVQQPKYFCEAGWDAALRRPEPTALVNPAAHRSTHVTKCAL
jgi:hypothetical protein